MILIGLALEKYYFRHDDQNSLGQVNGLAWTSVGGELLQIEGALTAGKGRIIKTGSLGDVMQESIQAALTVAKNIFQKTYKILRNM